ncbi:glycoside hydrolase family 2 protein [Kiritimatiellota bacterium B12222]|nr:glycoside hydrolase family 2 protein [Kiritimatiellota bacterium B12222]
MSSCPTPPFDDPQPTTRFASQPRLTFPLDKGWRVRNQQEKKSIPAVVPGDIHGDLLRENLIPDPFFGENETELQWIGESDWVYELDFTLPESFNTSDRIELDAEGLDTLASIYVNGKHLADTDNMFRRWNWDVSTWVRPGQNRIEIHFSSALNFARKKQQESPMVFWNATLAASPAWIRKMQCNFGWDWGTRAVTCGIWRPIRLVSVPSARWDQVIVEQTHRSSGTVELSVDLSTRGSNHEGLKVECDLCLGSEQIARHHEALQQGKKCMSLTVEAPQLWWPNGMGEQPLYTLTCRLVNADGVALDIAERKIGLRTLRLDRSEDEEGERFAFEINGVPLFIKGANWIPADAIFSRLTTEVYRNLIQEAANAHMNMLRVWGGGIYEQDIFYDICDEQGILVWQDFMFACSSYPSFDPTFMESIRHEVQDNVLRLHHHACISLWCGNNELEQGLIGEEWTDQTMSLKDYTALFDDLIPQELRKIDASRPYWPGSPHSPIGNRYDHENTACGDVHIWNVWHGKEPFDFYRTSRHRFVSEFGFQSFPELKTVEAYTHPEERQINSAEMEFHQRSSVGNTGIMQYLLDWFRLPEQFENVLRCTQILQGVGIQIACEHWRRQMPRTMGTLYWQLNDTWPVASWSSIDYFGRLKALHYMARRFYAPVMLSSLESLETGTVELWLANDHLKSVTGCLKWEITDLEGSVLKQGQRQIRIPAQSSVNKQTISFKTLLPQVGKRNILMFSSFEESHGEKSESLALFAPPKYLALQEPQLTWRLRKGKAGTWTLSISSKKPALWVSIDFQETGSLSDNYFHLSADTEKTIILRPTQPLTAEKIRSAIRVQSLYETYTP